MKNWGTHLSKRLMLGAANISCNIGIISFCCQNIEDVFLITCFWSTCLCFLTRSFSGLNSDFIDLLTLISDVLKLGTVVVLVQDEDVELTNANQRVSCLVSGSHCHRILPLALAIKFPGCHNYSWRHRDNEVDQTVKSYQTPLGLMSPEHLQFNTKMISSVCLEAKL